VISIAWADYSFFLILFSEAEKLMVNTSQLENPDELLVFPLEVNLAFILLRELNRLF
jgi:hypothetical protein